MPFGPARLVKQIQDALSCGRAHRRAAFMMSDEIVETTGECRTVTRRDEKSRATVVDELAHPADIAGDNGKSGGHGLQHGDRQPLRPARQDEHVGLGEPAGNVVHVPEEADRARKPGGGGLLGKRLALGTIAQDIEGGPLRSQLCHCRDESREVLRRCEPTNADEPNRRGAAVTAHRRRARANGVLDHNCLLRPTSTRGKPCQTLPLGDADHESREGSENSLEPPVEDRRALARHLERPTMHRVDADRDPASRAARRPRIPAFALLT